MASPQIIGHDAQQKMLSGMGERRPHSLIFHGPHGTGKFLVARQFLMSLFCSAQNAPCGTCSACIQVERESHPDLIVVRPDEKGSIPIGSMEKKEEGSIRWLIDRLSRSSVSGIRGVIVDEIETVSTEGQNALLKTIEEPQEGAVIIMLTANRSQVLPTILSRSMEIPFGQLQDDEVRTILEREKVAVSEEIIVLSGGSVSTASLLAADGILEEVKHIGSEIVEFLRGSDVLNCDVSLLQKSMKSTEIIYVLTQYFRIQLLECMKKNSSMSSDGTALSPEVLKKVIKIFLALEKGMRHNLNMRHFLKGQLYWLRENPESDILRYKDIY